MKTIYHLINHVLEGLCFSVFSKEILLFICSVSARKDFPVVENNDNQRENGRRSSSRSKSRKKSSKSTRSSKRRSR